MNYPSQATIRVLESPSIASHAQSIIEKGNVFVFKCTSRCSPLDMQTQCRNFSIGITSRSSTAEISLNPERGGPTTFGLGSCEYFKQALHFWAMLRNKSKPSARISSPRPISTRRMPSKYICPSWTYEPRKHSFTLNVY